MGNFIRVRYDAQVEGYVDELTGLPVTFTKLLHVLLDTEEFDAKLTFTRKIDDMPTNRPVPMIAVDGQKLRLDDERLEIAQDCVVVS